MAPGGKTVTGSGGLSCLERQDGLQPSLICKMGQKHHTPYTCGYLELAATQRAEEQLSQ